MNAKEAPTPDRAPIDWDGVASAHSASDLRAQETWRGYDPVAPAYRLRGKHASTRTFYLSQDAIEQMEAQPEPALEFPRWYSALAYALIAIAIIFCMCAMGRPGA